jgi:DNA-binding GntR family transcriptional regulator
MNVRSPIKKCSFREQVYNEVRARLKSGEIRHDDRLVDHELAEELGVSRMPVREALLQLVSEGVLDTTTRGFALRRYSASEIEEIFEIRRLLEPPAAARAASRMTPSVLRQLTVARTACAEASRQGNVRKTIVTNATFRKIWQDQVPNLRLRQEIERFADYVQAVRLITLGNKEFREDSIERLTDLLEAFRQGNAKAVEKAVIKQLDHALNAFRASAGDQFG